MSFTIKCNNCGNEQVFTNGMRSDTEKFDIIASMKHGYTGSIVEDIEIYCENVGCGNSVELKY